MATSLTWNAAGRNGGKSYVARFRAADQTTAADMSVARYVLLDEKANTGGGGVTLATSSIDCRINVTSSLLLAGTTLAEQQALLASYVNSA